MAAGAPSSPSSIHPGTGYHASTPSIRGSTPSPFPFPLIFTSSGPHDLILHVANPLSLLFSVFFVRVINEETPSTAAGRVRRGREDPHHPPRNLPATKWWFGRGSTCAVRSRKSRGSAPVEVSGGSAPGS
ncbi:hypothetical protein Taro_002098 [Colocasia esculenta]|uniref:Uncharacterized protein n=1 Tax=Colocasia esculenta TaxID=4460 RepID=A0A843TJV5_COLES|nr:hypothetical protein [Colocasia esculenta]